MSKGIVGSSLKRPRTRLERPVFAEFPALSGFILGRLAGCPLRRREEDGLTKFARSRVKCLNVKGCRADDMELTMRVIIRDVWKDSINMRSAQPGGLYSSSKSRHEQFC